MAMIDYTVMITETRKRRVTVRLDVPQGEDAHRPHRLAAVAAALDGDHPVTPWSEPVARGEVLFWTFAPADGGPAVRNRITAAFTDVAMGPHT